MVPQQGEGGNRNSGCSRSDRAQALIALADHRKFSGKILPPNGESIAQGHAVSAK